MNTGSRLHVPGAVLLLGLVVGATALLAATYTAQPPTPVDASAAADAFSAQRAYPILERLSGDQAPHAVGTSANAAVRERVNAELSRLGFQVEEQSALGCSQAFLGWSGRVRRSGGSGGAYRGCAIAARGPAAPQRCDLLSQRR